MERLTLDQALARADESRRAERYAEARRICAAVARAFPDDPRVRRVLADLDRVDPVPPAESVDALLAHCRKGQFDAAVAQAEQLVAAYPGSFALWNTLGGACTKTGRLERAEDSFRKAIELDPGEPGAHYNLGLVLHRSGRLKDATASYVRAVDLRPDHVQALNNLGNALADLGRMTEAEAAYGEALKHRPDFADAFSNLGRALRDQGRHDEAMAAWSRALELVPGHAAARSQTLRLQFEACDFRGHEEFARIRDTLGVSGEKVPPFAMLPAEDHPARQLLRSRNWVRDLTTAPRPRQPRKARRPKRLRVGYFSADFHDHPTLRLVSGLLREHDRTRFEISVYSYGRQKSGEARRALRHAIPDFHDVEHLAPGEIAALARSHGLDIAIDLNGHTRAARAEIFACRPADLAVGFLGFPGTTAADFIDYLVADAVVIPQAEREHYSEHILYLPDSYQPNDDCLTVPETTDTRADHGLPQDGAVLCCFNTAAKIGPPEFDIWMRLLRKVDGSVLWLLRANAQMQANLSAEAARRGVDPARLVFAEKRPHAEHLARQRHADLFLDTFNFNAHTTASDALRVGLPVVTMAGRQFAARVAASLLTAVGLPELITNCQTDYEALALKLASGPDALAAIRKRLSDNLPAMPLFDTRRYTRNFEAALDAAFDLHVRGEDPRDIRI